MNDPSLAKRFTALHVRGDPLLLYNIWDAGSARIVAEAGALAVATGSASVAAAQGYEDGETLPLDDLVRTTGQIVRAISLPVSVDMEAGYGRDAASVATTATRLAAAGVIGCNIEDRIIGGDGLYTETEQAERLRAIRDAVTHAGLALHVNARTDVFLAEPDESRHAALLPAALARADAYRAAGADSLFAPWLIDSTLIASLCEASPLPVNVMWRDGMADIVTLASVGVARVSFGPGPYRATAAHLAAAAEALYTRP